MPPRVLGVLKFCGPLWWCRSNLFFLTSLLSVCVGILSFFFFFQIDNPEQQLRSLSGGGILSQHGTHCKARPILFLKKKTVGRADYGTGLVTSVRVFLCFFLAFFLLFLLLSVTFFVFLSLPPLGSLSAFQSLFRFWAHVASAIS